MFCFKCKSSKPTVDVIKNGTMVSVIQNCPECGDKAFKWVSQPLLFTKYPAGNILLSFGVLMAGASISKILLVFRHMGVCATNIRTYFLHQQKFILPAVAKHWERYRNELVTKVKQLEDIVWCGDGRFDSVGHSAKYGTYSMFCSPVDKIVHFEILQVKCFPYKCSPHVELPDVLSSEGITLVVFKLIGQTSGSLIDLTLCACTFLCFYLHTVYLYITAENSSWNK